MTNAQTEARVIAERWTSPEYRHGLSKEIDTLVATALAAKDAELAVQIEAKEHARRECDRAEAQLAEANKALVIANAQLDNMEFLSVEGFMDWQQEYRAARRALEEQGGENGL